MKWVRRQPTRLPSCVGALSGDLACGHDLALRVLGRRALGRSSGIVAMPYLWRRFGPPRFGSDDDKDLCCYILTTPDPEVFLTVRPAGSALAYGIGYLVSEQIEDERLAPVKAWELAYREWMIRKVADHLGMDAEADYADDDPKMLEFQRIVEEWWFEKRREAVSDLGEHPNIVNRVPWSKRRSNTKRFSLGRQLWHKGPPLVRRVNAALEASLEDLLRPVGVRDVQINILGRDERTFMGRSAPRFAKAGVGCVVATVGK